VKLSLAPDDRPAPPSPPQGGGGKWSSLLVYGLLLPFSLAIAAAAGWYVVTGENPLDLLAGLSMDARIVEPMPPRPGPEKPESSLIQPQTPKAAAAANAPAADVKLPAAPSETPAVALPQAPAAPIEAKAPAVPGEAKMPTAPSEAAGAPPVTPPVAPIAPAPEASHGKPAEEKPPAITAVSDAAAPALTTPTMPPGGDSLPPPSFGQLPAREDLKPLSPGPLPELLRRTGKASLPVMAEGKEARTAYARPFLDEKKRPRLAVIVTGLGLSNDATQAAISKLPPEVTLSFSPYAGNLAALVKKAREAGHEVMLDLPLEPTNFPMRDAGPDSILVHHAASEALEHLEAVLGKADSYVGLAAHLRSPVTASENWVTILQALKGRGLMFVGDGLVGVPANAMPAAASVTLVADDVPFRAAIDVGLSKLAAAALRDGTALAYLSARPVSFERLLAWVASLPQQNLVLAPASAVVKTEEK